MERRLSAWTTASRGAFVKSNSYVPAHAQFALDAAAKTIHRAYDSYGVMLVGSCLDRQDYRDVDVRCVLADDEFEAMFPKDESEVLRPRWQMQRFWPVSTTLSKRGSLMLSKIQPVSAPGGKAPA